ncbi:MAG: AI-2E family transporter [Peptococcaceae bacterium]|nr:AI-2E family transporter [Peptococcaceae bacterium]
MGNLSLKKFTQFALVLALVCLGVSYLPEILTFGGLIWSAASPLIIGCVMAYVLNILLIRLEKIYFPHSSKPIVRKSRRLVCILLSFVILLTISMLVINVVLPEVASSVTLIVQEIPRVWEEVRVWLIANADYIPVIQQYLEQAEFDWATSLKKAFDAVANSAGDVVNSAVGIATSAFGILAKLVIGLIFALYLLFGKEKLQAQGLKILKAYLKPDQKEKTLYVLRTVHESFSNFIVGQCTEAVILGGLCALGMTILQLPYAVMTGTIIGVSALIPVAGAYIGGALGAFMIFTVDPAKAVIFLVFLLILQQVEGNLIYPRVVGNSIGLPGLWVLAAVTIGGGVMGVGGMLIGVPMSAALYRLFADHVNGKLETK